VKQIAEASGRCPCRRNSGFFGRRSWVTSMKRVFCMEINRHIRLKH